jgi:hypothetical protein
MYYGPFRILEKIGQATYKLQLPTTTDIHPIFHVSQLKKHLGPKADPQKNLPLVTPESASLREQRGKIYLDQAFQMT